MIRSIISKIYFSEISEARKKSRFGYKKQFSDTKIEIYKRGFLRKKILSVCENWAVLQGPFNPNHLYLYPNINSKIYKKIVLSSKRFPGLIEGSTVLQCMLIPYMREISDGVYVKCMRLNIITDKCQVFHNYPSRGAEYERKTLYGDETRFEESAIWDVPGHLYPTDSLDHSEVERYYPYLPSAAYEYHPAVNSAPDYLDPYKNGGFGKEREVIQHGKRIKVSRFYFPKRCAACNSFFHIGGEEPNYKMTVIGTYRANNNGNGVRTVVLASSDGGRNWYAKYEFGDLGEYRFSQGKDDWRTAFGNVLRLPEYTCNNGEKLFVTKRNVVVPSEECKEPETAFFWERKIPVLSISNDKTAVIRTKEKHNLVTGNIVALCISSNDLPFTNNLIDDYQCGNGVLYKVEVLDDTSFYAYEYVASAHNPICCRHIHQINRIKDGWLIGTGEIYPNGWLLYMQMRAADTYTRVSASEDFPIIRLNSSEKSVQRTLGAIMIDDKDSTIIYASDHDLLSMKRISCPEERNLTISRGSVGIYRGRLCDIDDRSKFAILYEANEPSFFFKSIRGLLVFAGQMGEIAISSDMGKKWNVYRIDTETHLYRGSNNWFFVIGDCIFVNKNL